MATTVFVNGSTLTDEGWFNDVDAITYDGLTTQMLVGGGAGVIAAWTAATGSGSPVRGTSPSFTTSVVSASTTLAVFNTVATTVNAFGAASTALNIGHASGTNTILGASTFSQGVTLSSALTYGGVTLSNAVTGTGNMVLSASPTLAGTLTAAAITASSTITLSGTAANIATGSNYISNGGTDAGLSFDASNNATLSAALAITGALTGVTTLAASGAISGTGADNSIILSQNAATQWRINNANAGAAATANLLLQNGTTTAGVYLPGTGYTSVGAFAANAAILYGNNAAGVAIVADAGPVKIAAGGTTAVATFSGTAGASRIDAGIRIGADSTNNLLDDASNGAGTATLYIGNASVNVTSDERVKTNVREWNGDASAILNALPVKAWDAYTQNDPQGGYTGGYVGFTAQDLHKAAPWAVNTQGDTGLPWQARYEFLNGIIVKGWQDHDARIAKLERMMAQ